MNRPLDVIREVVGGLSLMAVLFGTGYLLDCRINSGASLNDCWFAAAGYMGIGTAGQVAYRAGFWTPNPGISQETRNRFAQTDKPEG